MDRFSEYRIMWILVFFDLPTETKKDKKEFARDFVVTVSRCSSFPFMFAIAQAWRMQKCTSSE